MIQANGFTPWFGVVENVNDPLKCGRYQVRVFGYNPESKGLLPTANLRWFSAGVSNSAGSSSVGHSPTGYMVGSFVFGYFIDPDLQEGIIVMSLTGMPGGLNDVCEAATGEGGAYVASLKGNVVKNVPDARGETWSEPESAYAAQYPNNQVFQSQSGHVVEYDDTPGAERITVYHRSGTFKEIHPDGKQVTKTVGESFDIHLGGHNIFVNGSLNLVASGDYRISVGGEYYVKAKNVVFDTEVVDIYGVSNANDHISGGVSGGFHIHPETNHETTLSPVGYTPEFAPTPKNAFSFEYEETPYTPEIVEYALNSGFITPEEAETVMTEEPVVEDKAEEPAPVEVKPVISECGLAIVNGKVDYTAQLSPNFNLRSLSLGAVVSQYAIKAQGGLTEQDIICNLKNLAENVLEPIKAKYPNMMVTSAFRAGSGTSQHLKGEAVDIQFRGASKAFYFEVAKWIKDNLPYDQFLLEYKSTGTRMPWIHVSLTRKRSQRGQVMTFFNHKKYANGLVQVA
ncbi:hypothetical protein pf16_208 [Pseudomonas phage pf16]|uniref:Protein Gp5 N-terminal OB-fold domain-containing protein n=1 Tax=Pseudomonas phage pf16 TaxID=1815630 RepID=A0A1S5R3Y7_9CAUD|nr:baseplate hub subunit and tail lysozyme [Pseudomonas phage pf16]AND75131.1 hypothetical protein pf16_208 [Pseudomonas phage pf16]